MVDDAVAICLVGL